MAPGRAAESPLHTSELHAFDGRPVEVRELFTPGLPVVNAGLVLIAPYLPRFLATVSLVPASAADNSEPNPSRVPLLLHWLATGSAEAVEHELVLPKVLAGIALDEPVVCRHAFPEATLAEANRMLASVIVHWSVLKETSVPGLRESFLQRGGLLREDDAQWLLRVEHRAWDVLLDRVPWTFRTLRLPWMERPVMVEWEAYA